MTPVLVLLAATPTPAPPPTQMQPWEVSPGITGFFLGFFVLAVVCIPLFRSMNKHMRRVDHNQRLLERAEELEAERAGETQAAETQTGKTQAASDVRPARTTADGAGRDGAHPGTDERTD
ncbi:hypothetical protein [Georgenia sp. SYP-B2076]|uniref:hypothetical protein n=1 Tax=Georgenia sp. SYP-B2076 TaxID=2495881 RepID=UPI000F8EC967|nr:hypothetical protein [Georgenia sp. SYP-B2076]